MSKPSNQELYRWNEQRISVFELDERKMHRFAGDFKEMKFHQTHAEVFDCASACGVTLTPGYYAVLNIFEEKNSNGKNSNEKNNWVPVAITRLPDERYAVKLTHKLYDSELARYKLGLPNSKDPEFQSLADVLFFDGKASTVPEQPASVSMPEVQGPLLNEKNGMVDVGKIVNGQIVSFWVPKPEYVQIAPGILISRALLEQGAR
jgi:hypothetical protein